MITGGERERYKVPPTPEGVTAKLSLYDPAKKGRDLIIEAGANPKEGMIVIIDESQPNEAGIVIVKVFK